MKAADLAVVKALPGNNKCVECGMKNPQWASVSFGTVFCLECSGVHRSLGVHISFVRSIAMDSWTPAQIALMKAGGNEKCASYLQSKGISSSVPIKQKYENDAAKLYKEVLKARAAGEPEPTSLPTAATSTPKKSSSANNKSRSAKFEDPNGMERLSNESEADYVVRQTRLRDEAKARMAAKFGSNGKRTMGGVGSTPAQSNFDLGDMTGSLTSGMQSAADGFNAVWGQAKSSGITESVTEAGLGLWKNLSLTAQTTAQQVSSGNAFDFGSVDDGLESLSRKMKNEKQSTSDTYAGFGSEDMQMKTSGEMKSNGKINNTAATAEDPDGIAPLTGESDKEYMERQIRIRQEAKKRMEKKFGINPNLGAASSKRKEGSPSKVNVSKMREETNDDFFSSFGA